MGGGMTHAKLCVPVEGQTLLGHTCFVLGLNC